MIRLQAIWIPLALFGAAGLLALDPWPFQSPVQPAVAIPAWATNPTPLRQPDLRPDYSTAGYTYRCSDCHRILSSPQEPKTTLIQHTEIRLNHGLNTHCLNCHHRTQRDAFADDQGHPIPWDQPQQLCARCHGPVFRDWEHGSHGRINGYWNKALGPQIRRKCIECHDPHSPAFPHLPPAPGPHTLRMGPPSPGVHEGKRDPLRIYAHDPDASTDH